jgi:hypothetical protein
VANAQVNQHLPKSLRLDGDSARLRSGPAEPLLCVNPLPALPLREGGLLDANLRRLVRQQQFELNLVAQRDAVGANERDLRLEAAGDFERVAVNGRQDEAALLVEPQCPQVVIGRYNAYLVAYPS